MISHGIVFTVGKWTVLNKKSYNKINVLESDQFLGVSNRATKSVLRRLIAQKNVQEMLSKVINSWEMFLKVVNSWVCLIELLNPFSGG